MSKYLFTEEWNDGGVNHVTAYGKCTESKIDDITDQMERYSPYDYCCANVSDTEEEYKDYLQARIDNGDEVKYND